MYVTRHEIDITTNSTGSGTGYSPITLNGELLSIAYVASTSVPYSTDVEIAVTAERSGMALLSLETTGSVVVHPRGAVNTTTGAVLSTSAPALLPVADERLKIVVSNGGDTKSGKFHCYVD